MTTPRLTRPRDKSLLCSALGRNTHNRMPRMPRWLPFPSWYTVFLSYRKPQVYDAYGRSLTEPDERGGYLQAGLCYDTWCGECGSRQTYSLRLPIVPSSAHLPLQAKHPKRTFWAFQGISLPSYLNNSHPISTSQCTFYAWLEI